MTKYANYGGNSNVDAFEIHDNYIDVSFRGTPKIYSYSYGRAGKKHVDNMKVLAMQGYGLNGYINHYVKFLYDR